ncbi:glycosyltransferase family 2 protein [Aquibacillus rhizosphaerae]|uniref:Glycosyltransferase family 2 protein n=1 Tax=Aquibacillus rhizosphaerae TaxID=3051431 RepID=A0ABT7L1Q0_9BACI|nr:glycosyltransferase family 2 protein [Aquibacillus sp. LR5S19]MDL4839771.1 glycosyltransferase family 2 protein [Aquibacillus sp. LR5S19]
MLKDITAILVDYAEQSILNKALFSLIPIRNKLHSIIVITEEKISTNFMMESEWFDKIEFISNEINDSGQLLNNTIDEISTEYVLLLQDTDYLSPKISSETLELDQSKTALVTSYEISNKVIHRPYLLLTSFIKKEKFMSDFQLPFKESRLPAMLLKVEISCQQFKEGVVKQARKNSSTNSIEKAKIIEKYQLNPVKTNYTSLSVIVSNYNMEKYVETAVVSCLLQNEHFDQILIIDDGSTDNSYNNLKQWNKFNHVKIFHKKNEGKAIALNQLLSEVTSDFILELDADDWLDPDAVSTVKELLHDLPKEFSLLYGNLKKWKQLDRDVVFKGESKGIQIDGISNLLSYHFPLGPRIYRTSSLKEVGGFPVIPFENGRLYEDVSVLTRLINISKFHYQNFTIYNVREHKESITRNSDAKWNEYLKILKFNINENSD